MQQGPGRFELTLNVHEMMIVFFVMVVLFTSLLFFGYHVGYDQSRKTILLRSQPPSPVQQAPQVEVEPEIRLENTPPVASPRSPLGVPAPGTQKQETREPLA